MFFQEDNIGNLYWSDNGEYLAILKERVFEEKTGRIIEGSNIVKIINL